MQPIRMQLHISSFLVVAIEDCLIFCSSYLLQATMACYGSIQLLKTFLLLLQLSSLTFIMYGSQLAIHFIQTFLFLVYNQLFLVAIFLNPCPMLISELLIQLIIPYSLFVIIPYYNIPYSCISELLIQLFPYLFNHSLFLNCFLIYCLFGIPHFFLCSFLFKYYHPQQVNMIV